FFGSRQFAGNSYSCIAIVGCSSSSQTCFYSSTIHASHDFCTKTVSSTASNKTSLFSPVIQNSSHTNSKKINHPNPNNLNNARPSSSIPNLNLRPPLLSRNILPFRRYPRRHARITHPRRSRFRFLPLFVKESYS